MSRLHAAAFGWFLVVIGAAAVACQAVELTTESQCDRKYELVLQTELRHSQQLQALQSRLTALENQQAEIKTDVNSLQASFHKQGRYSNNSLLSLPRPVVIMCLEISNNLLLVL